MWHRKKTSGDIKQATQIPIARVTLKGIQAADIEYEIIGHVPRRITMLSGDTLTIQMPREALTDEAFTIK